MSVTNVCGACACENKREVFSKTIRYAVHYFIETLSGATSKRGNVYAHVCVCIHSYPLNAPAICPRISSTHHSLEVARVVAGTRRASGASAHNTISSTRGARTWTIILGGRARRDATFGKSNRTEPSANNYASAERNALLFPRVTRKECEKSACVCAVILNCSMHWPMCVFVLSHCVRVSSR